MPILASWINRIFDKLTMVYGHQFIGRWSGLDLVKVKADWAEELDGFGDHGEAIKYALDHLDPHNPPTVLQFREICRRAPDKKVPQLPQPEANPEHVAKVLAKVSKAFDTRTDPLYRQREHMQMELSGQRIGAAQRDFWRRSLADENQRLFGINTAEKFSLDELRAAMQRKAA